MHRVAFVIYPGFELLDMSGPVAVFDGTNHVLAQSGKAPFYGVEIVSAEGGMVTSSSGVAVQSLRRSALTSKRIDTLLVAGRAARAPDARHRPLASQGHSSAASALRRDCSATRTRSFESRCAIRRVGRSLVLKVAGTAHVTK